MSAKILITGVTGMIGGRLAERLVDSGQEVRALSRDPARIAHRFPDAARMPPPDAGAAAWRPLLEDVTHVVHCAGIADASAARGEAELQGINARWPGRIAEFAAGSIPGRFVHLSSIRAVAGPASAGTINDASPEKPGDAYGRSKLEGEEAVRTAFAGAPGFTILRPAPVYGVPFKGNLALLLRLARVPVPLPLANLRQKRSLLALDACVDAILHVLSNPPTDGGTYVVADREPISIAAILAAFRRGAGRSPMLFPVPDMVLSAVCSGIGRRGLWRQMTQDLTVDPDGLMRTGWTPASDTLERLADLVRAR